MHELSKALIDDVGK
ncbi:hypothetical protein SOP89_05300 [Pseudomonas siliginis]|nr:MULTISPECIES: hypothetical protein [Pseudomonas]MEB2650781.1 hypothetical protein [Pseudomonas siliginis]UST77002.1 hypothetical protein NF675_01370 [Pseudomonas siliginis]UST98029.1 hypothetical protein NF679_01355 [Pseudomonas siliginis]